MLQGVAIASRQHLEYCNPIAKDSDCPPDLAFATSTSFDFKTASWNKEFSDFWTVKEDRKELSFGQEGEGLLIHMSKAKQAPAIISTRYMLFGKLSVEAKAAKGTGIITAITLKSDSGDEIAWEMLGSDKTQAQTNYFYDGHALYNTYNTTYSLGSSSSYDQFHTYTLEWTDTVLKFSIDGDDRKIWHIQTTDSHHKPQDTIPTEKWPQTPMQIKLGVWAVNPDSDAGEIIWAGGVPNWNEQPFTAEFRNVQLTDYMGWCEEPSQEDMEYRYDERTHGWADVKVVGCKKRRFPGIITNLPLSKPSTTPPSEPNSGQDAPSKDKGGKGDAVGRNVVSGPLGFLMIISWILLW